MSNALLSTAINHNIIIEQKFLEVGHTQMEADSMHSTIERALKNKDINVPVEYVEVCRSARKKPKPYDVTYLSHEFFKKFNDVLMFKSTRPGRGRRDAKVTDIRALRYGRISQTLSAENLCVRCLQTYFLAKCCFKPYFSNIER